MYTMSIGYAFSRLKVLVADGEPAMQRILRGVLSSLGIGEIIVCGNGEEALTALREHDPDIAIVEWVMAPLDGIYFTQQVRQADNIPDPYLPIIFMTAFSSRERVCMARDAGITEFLSKPFTARRLYKRLEQIIENPRSFVQSPGFLGPDRRRKDPGYTGPDRRGRPKDGGYTPGDKPNIEIKIIPPSKRLKDKVGEGGIADGTIKKAELKLEEIRNEVDFKPIAMEQIEWVDRIKKDIRLKNLDHESALTQFSNIFVLLKANGGMFDYPLIGKVAANLLDFLESIESLNDDGVDIVTAHSDTLLLILRTDMKGDIDPAGWALVDELKKVCERYFAKYPKNTTKRASEN